MPAAVPLHNDSMACKFVYKLQSGVSAAGSALGCTWWLLPAGAIAGYSSAQAGPAGGVGAMAWPTAVNVPIAQSGPGPASLAHEHSGVIGTPCPPHSRMCRLVTVSNVTAMRSYIAPASSAFTMAFTAHSAATLIKGRDAYEGPSKGMARVFGGALSLLGSQAPPLFPRLSAFVRRVRART